MYQCFQNDSETRLKKKPGVVRFKVADCFYLLGFALPFLFDVLH